jgi:hypothetical protein
VFIGLESSGATATLEWQIVENYVTAAGTKDWDGAWRTFVISPYVAADTSGAASFDYSDVRTITIRWDSANENFRSITNCWVDVMYFGTGLIVTGTSFTFSEIAEIDEDIDNKYGVITEIDGVLFVNGILQIGDGSGTTELNSSNEVLAFRNTAVTTAATRETNVADGCYQILFTGSTTDVTALTLTVLSSGLNDNNRPDFTVDSSVTAFTMAGSAIQRGGVVTFHSDPVVFNTVFTNCQTIYPSGATFYSNTIADSASERALRIEPFMSAQTSFSACTFIDNFSAATWIDDSGSTGVFAFTNHVFTNNVYDLLNTSGGDLTINLTSSNASSSLSPSGGSVTFVSTTNYTLTNLQPDTEVRIYTSGTTADLTTAGDELYGIESATGSTTFQYGSDVITSGSNVVVMIHNVAYETIRFVTDLDGTDTTQQIQQQFDRNYENP